VIIEPVMFSLKRRSERPEGMIDGRHGFYVERGEEGRFGSEAWLIG